MAHPDHPKLHEHEEIEQSKLRQPHARHVEEALPLCISELAPKIINPKIASLIGIKIACAQFPLTSRNSLQCQN